ncbi:MAG: hypothetical protein PVH82_10300 [Desulfobacteraceae bacterium]
MKAFCLALAVLLFSSAQMVAPLFAADLNGLWTKTTSPDPNNITIFYLEKNEVKAMGYGEIGGEKTVWYAEGEIKGNTLRCNYRYSEDAIPAGWAQEGVMELTLSPDGKEMTGTARAASGDWFGVISFVRARLFPQVERWANSNLTQNLDPFSGGLSSPPPTLFDGQGQLGILALPKQVK